MTTDELIAVEMVTRGGRAELTIEGELDVCNADLVEHQVSSCADVADVAGVDTIVLDLRGVSFCDGAGYRALVRGWRSVAAQAVRCEVRPSRAILRLTDVLGDFVGGREHADARA
jgi:anti-anti-sigma factor